MEPPNAANTLPASCQRPAKSNSSANSLSSADAIARGEVDEATLAPAAGVVLERLELPGRVAEARERGEVGLARVADLRGGRAEGRPRLRRERIAPGRPEEP